VISKSATATAGVILMGQLLDRMRKGSIALNSWTGHPS
jgi:hypothetical protein